MGSISTYLVHKSPVPVTVIRPQKKKKATHKRPVHAVPLSQSKVSFEKRVVSYKLTRSYRCPNRSVGCGRSQQGSRFNYQQHRQKDIYQHTYHNDTRQKIACLYIYIYNIFTCHGTLFLLFVLVYLYTQEKALLSSSTAISKSSSYEAEANWPPLALSVMYYRGVR